MSKHPHVPERIEPTFSNGQVPPAPTAKPVAEAGEQSAPKPSGAFRIWDDPEPGTHTPKNFFSDEPVEPALHIETQIPNEPAPPEFQKSRSMAPAPAPASAPTKPRARSHAHTDDTHELDFESLIQPVPGKRGFLSSRRSRFYAGSAAALVLVGGLSAYFASRNTTQSVTAPTENVDPAAPFAQATDIAVAEQKPTFETTDACLNDQIKTGAKVLFEKYKRADGSLLWEIDHPRLMGMLGVCNGLGLYSGPKWYQEYFNSMFNSTGAMNKTITVQILAGPAYYKIAGMTRNGVLVPIENLPEKPVMPVAENAMPQRTSADLCMDDTLKALGDSAYQMLMANSNASLTFEFNGQIYADTRARCTADGTQPTVWGSEGNTYKIVSEGVYSPVKKVQSVTVTWDGKISSTDIAPRAPALGMN